MKRVAMAKIKGSCLDIKLAFPGKFGRPKYPVQLASLCFNLNLDLEQIVIVFDRLRWFC